MKNLLNLGKALNKAEQKEIIGGADRLGSFYNGGCVQNCSTKCPEVALLFGSKKWQCIDNCATYHSDTCIIFSS